MHKCIRKTREKIIEYWETLGMLTKDETIRDITPYIVKRTGEISANNNRGSDKPSKTLSSR